MKKIINLNEQRQIISSIEGLENLLETEESSILAQELIQETRSTLEYYQEEINKINYGVSQLVLDELIQI